MASKPTVPSTFVSCAASCLIGFVVKIFGTVCDFHLFLFFLVGRLIVKCYSFLNKLMRLHSHTRLGGRVTIIWHNNIP